MHIDICPVGTGLQEPRLLYLFIPAMLAEISLDILQRIFRPWFPAAHACGFARALAAAHPQRSHEAPKNEQQHIGSEYRRHHFENEHFCSDSGDGFKVAVETSGRFSSGTWRIFISPERILGSANLKAAAPMSGFSVRVRTDISSISFAAFADMRIRIFPFRCRDIGRQCQTLADCVNILFDL